MEKEKFESFGQLVKARRSMREFSNQPVPEALLKEVFSEAAYAPSNCNTQPWKAVVVTGNKALEVQNRLLETVGHGHNQMDYPFDDACYPPQYKERQREVAKLFYGAAGISREERGLRKAFVDRNLTFYGAPHAVFLFLPDWAREREAADLGMFAQTLMLGMRDRGIGSCPQTILGFNADAIRQQLEIEPAWKLMFGISFGYADFGKPLNMTRTSRANLDSWFTIV